MRTLKIIVLFLGRLFISSFFILSAINKIIDWQNTERGFVSLLCDWHGYLSHSPFLQSLFSTIMSFVPFILVLVTAIELVGGVLILIGVKPRLGAFLLIIFLIPITILFHQFWFVEGHVREMAHVMFLKNLSILGGLFFILVFGGKIEKPSTDEIQIDETI